MVAEAADGLEALELCRSFAPDLVLMDVGMPRMGGLEATRAIKRELPHTIVLIMTALEDPGHLAEALRAGAAGYVTKTASPRQIIGAVREALDGEYPLNQEVAKRLLLELVDKEREGRPAGPGELPAQRQVRGGGLAPVALGARGRGPAPGDPWADPTSRSPRTSLSA